jgi:IS1 family transposase/transposase-like protein
MDAPTATTPTAPACRSCDGRTILWGRDRKGYTRHRCKVCGATFGDIPARPLGCMRIDLGKATLCLNLLVEGTSIRSAERVTGVHRDTITRLLGVAGAKAEALLNRLVHKVEAKDIQADEIWAYVGMKEKTKVKAGITDPQKGDAYTFVGFERHSKVVLAWHLGRRTSEDSHKFMTKLDCATSGHFQLSTDGFEGYPDAVEARFGSGVDYAQLIKSYGNDMSDERRYSPPSIIGVEKRAISGNPDEARVCTSHVERQNLTMRMQLRRLTRLTNGFSKKWENLRSALALHFWNYNFCWMHSTIRCTPAMAAGVARRPLRVADLLAA